MNAATRQDLKGWFRRGVMDGKKRMVVWCDQFDYSDYPEFTDLTGEDLRSWIDQRNGTNMRQLMEVYDLTAPMAEQMNQHRAFNY